MNRLVELVRFDGFHQIGVHACLQRNSGKTIYSLAEGYAGLPAPFDKWLHRGDGSGCGGGADHNVNATWVRKPQAPE